MIEVRNRPEEQNYEITVDGERAGLIHYVDQDGRLVFVHTEIDPGHEGQGLGSRLVAAALDDVRAAGRQVVPRCPFVAAFLQRHAEYADVVDPEVDRPRVVAEVRACFDDYEQALLADDVDRLDHWFHEGAGTSRFGLAEEQYGSADIAAWRRGAGGVHPQRRVGRVTVSTVGDRAAVVACEFRNGDEPGVGRQSQTWFRFPEGWRIVHDHVSFRPPG